MKPVNALLLLSLFVAPVVAHSEESTEVKGFGRGVIQSDLGENIEFHLDSHSNQDPAFTNWQQDDSIYLDNLETTVEIQQVTKQNVTTKKLTDVVPPIRFQSGEADVPEEYVSKLREILQEMRDRINVRLHFVGHSDNAQLFGEAKQKYGDNLGLSKERAGTTAEFFQQALDLPPEAISYEGVGESKPIASNDTEQGRAQNRRVEVQVWYDEVSEELVDKEVEVQQQLKRIKVCRVETVCMVRYKDGHSRRAKLKNLVPPLHYDDNVSQIPQQYLNQLRQALRNLKDKDNVQLHFIGYTDDTPLSGRDARIYGDHVGLSKANARRVSLAIQDALQLPAEAIASTGKGTAYPLASNNSAKGRALNRRIEIEFWHDDPLEDLPESAQICPEASAAETVERIYNPPDGDIKPIYFQSGQPLIPEGYAQRLQRGMTDIADKGNVRLRFIGYTSNERLDRRTAMVYGDDIGLSTSRARRAMQAIKAELNLSDKQVEFEGRGYVQSGDVIAVGFIEAERSKVEVQIVYDELALFDDDEGLEINRITREVQTKNPYALNLMRISVDGQPINDPGKSIPDVQRCTDVALDNAQVQFKFDNGQLKPRLNVSAWPNVIAVEDNEATELIENQTHFKLYSNYPSYIDRAEVRVFAPEQSTRDKPMQVVYLDPDGIAEWQFLHDEYANNYAAPRTEFKYVLRVYDADGNFDETSEQSLWVIDQQASNVSSSDSDINSVINKELLVGYGENRLAVNNIRLPRTGGTISVKGNAVPPGYRVWFGGYSIPVSDSGEFGAELILPVGLHTVEVAITDNAGNGNVYLRELELKKTDWFTVGLADVTMAQDSTNGPASLVTGDDTHYDNDLAIDGRLAFYTKGQFANEWQLTASADTREGPLEDLFNNALDKSPDALFRRIDSDYYYPTYGDDSTVEEDAPTSGKFYLKMQKERTYGLWGSFNVGYTDTNLAHVDRALYGANVNLESNATTGFGEKRFFINTFAAEPGTLAARDEFRGTNGSLYYLRHQDILIGSDRLRVEIRDAISGLVVGVKNLVPGLDYDIDYLQGRILLTEPLSAFADDGLLIDSGDLSGHQTYLVARYEYTPGFDDIKDVASGGRAHYWLGDFVKFGLTAETQQASGDDSNLTGVDVTVRKNAGTWLRFEHSSSEGLVSSSLLSNDGGYRFAEAATVPDTNVKAEARRVDGSLRLEDVFDTAIGQLTFFHQQLDAGYSAPGLIAPTDTTTTGGALVLQADEFSHITFNAVNKVQKNALEQKALEMDVQTRINEHWRVNSGLRYDNRIDNSPVVPLTQEQGYRNDLAVKLTYDSRQRWSSYGFAQETIQISGNRDENSRVGVGGDYRTSDRFKVHGEVSAGDLGPALRVGTDYQMTAKTNIYNTYTFESERSDNGVRARRGNMTLGFKNRFRDSASVYMEERYTHGDVPTGLTHAMGFDLAATDRLNFGGNLDLGTLRDNNTAAKIDRKALGLRVGYKFDALTYAGAIEYRVDETEQPDTTSSERTTWLTKNSFKYLLNPNWRMLGKFNHSQSRSSLGDFYNGNFTEAVLGYAYRPVHHDALNTLFKYTYFYNLPTSDQLTINNSAAEFIQKSHILSLDLMYDLTRRLSLGGKYAYRLGQLAMERTDPQFFDSTASLYILRADWHFVHRWDVLLEGRMLDLPEAGDRRSGALVGIYRQAGDHLKAGIGYNFTDFSDDLTDLDYDSQGFFINVIGKF
jgi:flagellar motor protein MotB